LALTFLLNQSSKQYKEVIPAANLKKREKRKAGILPPL
jgi:hypothetical protein